MVICNSLLQTNSLRSVLLVLWTDLPLPSSQDMLYFLPALYFNKLNALEAFHELSGFRCRALSPKIRCRLAQSAKLYSLSKDLAGRKRDTVVTLALSFSVNICKSHFNIQYCFKVQYCAKHALNSFVNVCLKCLFLCLLCSCVCRKGQIYILHFSY